MYYLGILLASIAGYLIGSFSWSIFIVKLKKNIDMSTVGSGNAGATNTTSMLGKKWGLLVTFLDALKVVVTAILALLLSLINNPLFSQTSYYMPCMFALIGHCFPMYYKFRGGKAVSCFLGIMFMMNWLYLLMFLMVWFSMIFMNSSVSVASMIASIIILMMIWLPWLNGVNTFIYQWNGLPGFTNAWKAGYIFTWFNSLHYFMGNNWASGMLESQIVMLISAFMLYLSHTSNMKRIVQHKEPETFPKKKKM